MKNKITITVDEKILKNVDSIIDRIYIRNRSQAIEYLIEKTLSQERKAVILASGPSHSLRIGNDEFRPTAKIGKTTVIEIAIKRLKETGFKEIFIIGEKEILTSIFSLIGDGVRYGVQIHFIEDRNPPGTASSLRLLKGWIKGSFIVISGDIIFNSRDIEKLWKHHFMHKGIATLLVATSNLMIGGTEIPIKHSILDIDGTSVVKIFPKKSNHKDSFDHSSLTYASIFVAEPEILEYPGHWVENEIFPELSKKGYLYSYLSRDEMIHIHSSKDKKFAHVEL